MANPHPPRKDTGSAKKDAAPRTIALNKRARHDYTLEDRHEAGIALQGWEVKALRAGRIAFTDSYAMVIGGEIFLIGAQITPLITASTHVIANDRRTRKLLLHRHEIARLVGAVERDGYTLVPLAMYWKQGKVKLEIALARGKQAHDKRAAIKDRDWARDKQRIMRRHNKDA
ncbi:MAG: SsrA-binding protein SmpB [Proteobacteria bacterium]|nr:SsrA-binding protein SmpB [Pseudomonadota bacterium]